MKSGKRSGMQNMSCGRTFHVLVATDTSTKTVFGYLGDRYEPGSQVTARRASNRILDGKTIKDGLQRSTRMPKRHVYSVRKKSWLSYQRERCNRIQNDHVIVKVRYASNHARSFFYLNRKENFKAIYG
jgi:hypothetical protein